MIWEEPESWGECSVIVFGQPGTTFDFLELPLAWRVAVRPPMMAVWCPVGQSKKIRKALTRHAGAPRLPAMIGPPNEECLHRE